MADEVLVTGGSQRLGAELVRAFAHAGWHVWCHFQRSHEAALALQAELRAAGRSVDTVRADLADPLQAVAMMQEIAARGGGLRAVVNNASLFEPDTGLDFEPAGARRQLDVNLLAPLLLGRELARQLVHRPRPDACVVHVLDQKVSNLNPDYFSYTVSKLALERAVVLQAQALAPAVRVCGVAPGLMYLSGPQSADNFARASRVNLLRRPIDPADVAQTCLFLARTPAITGATVCVDNGQHLVPLERDVMFVVDEWFKEAHGADGRG
ncbi:SDR family oxidoreductase [Pseudorhodoferax sp. Leaf274]|uniref:SDR family oxidoreductase n=1 Tax=Pseudorhodoferax sp. Leaf274 TaxID=1736318 RepID=UPI00070246A6|nr:SDR family oxidoreductase [Pseudorhodoferax sp. Leaf274]KQP45051.1 short-chain dehydrogenase [Pseudorhodoferax sp. Leaf274]